MTIALGPRPDAEMWIFAQDMMESLLVRAFEKGCCISENTKCELGGAGRPMASKYELTW